MLGVIVKGMVRLNACEAAYHFFVTVFILFGIEAF